MNKYWSLEEFKEIVKTAKTIKEVLRHFGLPSNQGHYSRMFHKYVKENNIDISHILESIKKQEFRKKLSIEEMFIANSHRSGKNLKTRLLKESLIEDKCSNCKSPPVWNGKLLVMQLDHINGDNTDNRIENLRLLCPNCHSQTDTFGGKNTKKSHAYKHVCKTCNGYKKNTKSLNCKACEDKSRKEKTKIVWPSKDIVIQMTEELGFVAAGKQLGVSDNAIRKFLKR